MHYESFNVIIDFKVFCWSEETGLASKRFRWALPYFGTYIGFKVFIRQFAQVVG